MKKAEGSDTFSEVKHTHKNPVASLDYAHINKSIIYVALRYITHQHVVSLQSTLNTGN